jgi:uncharacterized SAM-binding protein YcdF (DUF218 family)
VSAALRGRGRLRRGPSYDAAVFVLLSKVLDWFVAPLSWALLLLLAAAVLRRRGRTPRVLAGAAVAVLVLFSIDAVADRLQGLAERGGRSTFRPDVVYDAVVVLGGMVDAAASRASGDAELTEEADRLVRAFELVRAGRARNVLLTGGLVAPREGDVAEADRLAAKLAQWGVPPGQILVEATSRNTRENAIEAGRLAAANGWRTLLVVTSAAHVPRALGCFRAVGLAPDVLPVDFRASDGAGRGLLPRAAALAKSTGALRELFGRLVYRAAGYSR